MKINFLPQFQMTAAVEACDVAQSVRNTGVECDTSFGLLAQIIAAPMLFRTPLTDVEAEFDAAISADPGGRVYPISGDAAPIASVTNSNESDVTETLPNGQVIFIRAGYINLDLYTIRGGICFYDKLSSFIGTGFGFFLVDVDGKIMAKKFVDSTTGAVTYGPIGATLQGVKPTFTTDTTVYKNNYTLSLNPSELRTAKILTGGANLLAVTGLIDVVIKKTAAASTTIIKVGANTECANSNMFNLYAAGLADVDAWVVYDNAAPTTPITPTSVTQDATNKGWNLNGTWIPGHTYKVYFTTPANMRTATVVEGFDGTIDYATILIP